MIKYFCCLLTIAISVNGLAQTGASVSFTKWLSVQQAGSPVISNNGQWIAFTQTTTDWANNTYETEVWLSANDKKPFQLTRTEKGSSTQPRFTPITNTLVFWQSVAAKHNFL